MVKTVIYFFIQQHLRATQAKNALSVSSIKKRDLYLLKLLTVKPLMILLYGGYQQKGDEG